MTTATTRLPSTNYLHSHLASPESTEKATSEHPGPTKISFHIDFRDDYQGESCDSALKSDSTSLQISDETPIFRRSATDDDLALHAQSEIDDEDLTDWVQTERDLPVRHVRAGANTTHETSDASNGNSSPVVIREELVSDPSLMRGLGTKAYEAAAAAFERLSFTEPTKPVATIFSAQVNLQRANNALADFETRLEKLDAKLFKITGTHIFQAEASRRDSQQGLSTIEQASSFIERAQSTTNAMIQTAQGTTLGVALVGAGVATAGLLGPAVGTFAVGMGFFKVLNDLSNFPAEADRAKIRKVLEKHLPALQADWEKLESLTKQEQHRRTIKHSIVATMAMHNDHLRSVLHTLDATQKALEVRHAQQGTPLPPQVLVTQPDEKLLSAIKEVIAESVTQLDELAMKEAMKAGATKAEEIYRATEDSSLFTRIAESYNRLYHLIAALIHGIDVQRERLFLSLPLQSSHETAQTATMKAAEKAEATESLQEAAFKRDYRQALEQATESEILPKKAYRVASCDALMRLEAGNSSSGLTFDAMWRSIVIGANIFNMIQVEDPTYGAIDYTSASHENKKCNTLPSNLTIARSIAHYLDMQAHAPKVEGPVLATVSKNPDGSYSVADPGRKQYKFLAGAPSAAGNFLSHMPTDPLDTSAGRMTMYDYSGTFPGGANTMEFEPTFDSTGAPVLTIRFSNQEKTSVFRKDPHTVLTYIENQQKRLSAVAMPDLSTAAESVETVDFSDMSAEEIYAYQLKLQSVGNEQFKLIKEHFAAYGDVDLWNNRLYEQRPTA